MGIIPNAAFSKFDLVSIWQRGQVRIRIWVWSNSGLYSRLDSDSVSRSGFVYGWFRIWIITF